MYTSYGYLANIDGQSILFASEQEYLEYIEDNNS